MRQDGNGQYRNPGLHPDCDPKSLPNKAHGHSETQNLSFLLILSDEKFPLSSTVLNVTWLNRRGFGSCSSIWCLYIIPVTAAENAGERLSTNSCYFAISTRIYILNWLLHINCCYWVPKIVIQDATEANKVAFMTWRILGQNNKAFWGALHPLHSQILEAKK